MRRFVTDLAVRASVLFMLVLAGDSRGLAQNLVTNPEFATDTNGWQFLGPGGLAVDVWSPRDWREPLQQGSVRLRNLGDTTAGPAFASMFQCIPLPPGTSLLRFGAWVDLLPGQDPAAGDSTPHLRFRGAADCFSGSLLGFAVPPARGLPLDRPWIRYESTFPVPAGALAVELRLETIKVSGLASDPLDAFYDGAVLEAVELAPDLRTVVTVRGEVDTVSDNDGALGPSIVPGAPILVRIVYDEASSGVSSGVFSFDVPPGAATFRVGDAAISVSGGGRVRAELQKNAADDRLLLGSGDPFESPPEISVLGAWIELVDATGSTLPVEPGREDVALAELLADSRTVHIFGSSNLSASGSFDVFGSADSVTVALFSVFSDGFESGDAARWSVTVP